VRTNLAEVGKSTDGIQPKYSPRRI
jgi:hypothetical protein